jgi:hypothetical protein
MISTPSMTTIGRSFQIVRAWLAVVGTQVFVAGVSTVVAADAIDYNRDVRPILSEHCFACHGFDKNQRKADLRLDVRESALEHEAIVPGKPDESELVARIDSDDPDEVMPPPKSRKPLGNAQKDILRRWVAAGAPYAAHWAYTPLVRPVVAKPKDASRVRNPIDGFIQADLETRGIVPSPEADRRRLLRRLSLDLTGLPPTPEEVRAFLENHDPRAYEKQVERLLASPRYGERMAVGWLDVVRYADTVGYHGDQNQDAWPYRDYVIDSFNRNKPFDRFTVEQVAGDLLPEPTDEQRVATCFNRLNMMTREGGAQPKEYLAKYAADRVRTVAMTWLGSTFGCAECHDHKFDPIATRDFYALGAFFADVKQWGVYSDYGYTPNPDLRGFTNDHPFPPVIEVESAALLERIARLKGEIASAVREADGRLDGDPKLYVGYNAWRNAVIPRLDVSPDGLEAPPPAVNRTPAPLRAKEKAAAKAVAPAGPGPAFRVEDDDTVVFSGQDATNDEFALQPGRGPLAAIKVELLPDPEQGGKVLRAGASDATLRLSANLRRKGDPQTRPLAFRAADADRAIPRYQNGFAVLGILSGWRVGASLGGGRPLTGVWLLDRPTWLDEGDTLVVTLLDNAAARVRVSVSPLAPEDLKSPSAPAELANALNRENDSPGSPARAAYLRSTAWDPAAFAKLVALEAKIRECRGGKTPVMVTVSAPPTVTRVLPRGNWQDESGPVVEPAVPHFLPQPAPKPGGERLTRLDLARWLVAPENPLTARVFVNRLWKQFFGSGLSAQVDDLGAQGEWPVHPELLDWLAAEFRDGGWDVKHIVTLMVTSYTYRQEAGLRKDLAEIDPNNRLLASQSPRRLDAEFVRDNALAVAGLIDLEPGGPPSKPYQPAGHYENLQFPDRNYVAESDERQYRRGVYMHWQRTFLHPMLANFDAPSREDCVAARTAANSPQQALTLLNDPTFVEAARALATSLLSSGAPDDAARLDLAFYRALARPVSVKERQSLLALLDKVRASSRSGGDEPRKLLKVGIAPVPDRVDASELAAWTQVCRVIINLHETITRY